jgi:hypothetical protein
MPIANPQPRTASGQSSSPINNQAEIDALKAKVATLESSSVTSAALDALKQVTDQLAANEAIDDAAVAAIKAIVDAIKIPDIAPYLKSDDAESLYALKTTLDEYTKTADLWLVAATQNWVNSQLADINGLLDSLPSRFAPKTDLDSINTRLGAQDTAIAARVLSTDLTAIVQSFNALFFEYQERIKARALITDLTALSEKVDEIPIIDPNELVSIERFNNEITELINEDTTLDTAYKAADTGLSTRIATIENNLSSATLTTGRIQIGRFRPATPIDIEATLVNTGIDMRTAQYLTIFVRDSSTGSFDGASGNRSPAAMTFSLNQIRANGNIGFGVLYSTQYLDFRIRNLQTGQLFLEDNERGIQLCEVLVEDDFTFRHVIPTGKTVVTPRSITGSVTAQAYEEIDWPAIIPISSSENLSSVTVNNAPVPFNAQTGFFVVPKGPETAVIAHTTSPRAINPDFTHIGGNTNIGIMVPYRAESLLDSIEFNIRDRRSENYNVRNTRVIMPIAYFQDFDNNGWTYWRDGSNDAMWRDFTLQSGAVYRCHVYYQVRPQGLRFFFKITHANSEGYGAISDFVGKFV